MVRYDLGSNNINQNKNPKQNYDDYIESTNEPFDSQITPDISAEIEIEMAENIYGMRREFKRQNKKLRRLYSSKDPKRNDYKKSKGARFQHTSNGRAVA